jgi:hypothetical protein
MKRSVFQVFGFGGLQDLAGRKNSVFDLPSFAQQAIAGQADAPVQNFPGLIPSASRLFIPNEKRRLRRPMPVWREKNSRVVSGAFALCSEL